MRRWVWTARFFSVMAGGSLGVLMGLSTAGQGTAGAQEPRIVVFDAPGADLTANDLNGTFPIAINNAGEIAGYYADAAGTVHGFLRAADGKYTEFDALGADIQPGGLWTQPNSINDLGEIAGFYLDASYISHGFLRSSKGKFMTFDVPGVGGYGTTPIAINIEGAVVGYYTDPNYVFHSFLRSPDGKFTTWSGPDACNGSPAVGCFGSGASNVNAFGIIAGGFEDNAGDFVHHSFVRNSEGELKTVDVPGAGMGLYQGTGCPGCVLGLNRFGVTAGIWSDANSVTHGFIRKPNGTITTFDAPGAGNTPGSYQGTGCFSDCPVSLNDWGAVTGVYTDANYAYDGYLRDPEGQITTVDPPEANETVPLYGTIPDGINDHGVVTGYYIDANNVYHGFLRLPR